MKLIKSGVILLPGLLLSLSLFAQNDIPAFGKVDKADLEMKQCPFDAAAEAMVLFDVAEVYCFLNLNSLTSRLSSQLERHVRIKILNNKGLDFANIHIPFIAENNTEGIKNLSAETINLDATGNIIVTKVDKSSFFTKKMNKRYSEIIFAFPDVKVGSIIEYKYKDDADYLYAVRDWYFQQTIPVKFSRYILNFPNELVISAQPHGVLSVDMKQTSNENRSIKTFSMSGVPALRDEQYISCNKDYLQQVVPYMVSLDLPGQVTHDLLRTWPRLVKNLMEDESFGLQLKKNIPRTSDLDAMLVNISDPYKKMEIIHNYVKKNMQWNNMYGIWALDGVKSAWKDKKGTTGEINLILVNLLKDADIDAYPILISTRDHGRINIAIADYDQFNKVMAYVKIGEHIYVLDATDKYTPVQLIPFEVLYSEGLVIEKYDSYQWGWKPLWDDTHLFENSIVIEAAIDDKSIMKGEVLINSFDYSRIDRITKLKADKEKFLKDYFTSEDNSLKIDSLTFENTDTDSLPLVQFCRFTQNINSSGGYNYFSLNLFSGMNKNPFIADTRFSDVFFGANQAYTIDASISIPPGYSFETLPKNMRMRLPDTSIVFSRVASIIDKQLSVRMELQFKRPVYYSDEYDMFHEFYKKLFTVLNEQFVFKKNQ